MEGQDEIEKGRTVKELRRHGNKPRYYGYRKAIKNPYLQQKVQCVCSKNKAHMLFEMGVKRETLKKNNVQLHPTQLVDTDTYQLNAQQMELMKIKCKICVYYPIRLATLEYFSAGDLVRIIKSNPMAAEICQIE